MYIHRSLLLRFPNFQAQKRAKQLHVLLIRNHGSLFINVLELLILSAVRFEVLLLLVNLIYKERMAAEK